MLNWYFLHNCPVGRLKIYFHFSAYDECQNDDGCRDGGIQGLCITDQMQKCNHHCLQTKRNYRNKGYNANKLEYFLKLWYTNYMILIKCIYFQTAGYDICSSSIPYIIRPGSMIMSPNYPNNYENYANCSVLRSDLMPIRRLRLKS